MHTPKPWELLDEGTTIIVSGGPNNDDLAEFFYCDEHTVSVSREEALANARLFVAAPMMYRLLERFGDAVTDMFEQMTRGNWADDQGHSVMWNRQMEALGPLVQELIALRVIIGASP